MAMKRYSESYPFLEASQRLRVDYGKVLAFADELDAMLGFFVASELENWQLAVCLVWENEQRRRRLTRAVG